MSRSYLLLNGPNLRCAQVILVRFLSLVILPFLLFLSISNVYAAQVTLAWDPNTEPDLAGYKLYYGQSSRTYTDTVDVGNDTTYTVSGLENDIGYYFATTAYDSSDNESDFSAEVVFNSPVTASGAGNDLVLTWSPVEGTDHYVVYRNTTDAYFTPTSSDSIATVTGDTYTDAGILGDPDVDHFYVVKAVGGSGYAVGVSNRAGEVEFSLSAGYNMMAYILDQEYTTGQDLGEAIPYCTHVLRRDAATGQWVSVAQKVGDTWINHEDVSPGYAYMVYVTANGMWTQVGSVFPDPHFDLAAGYNMMTLPLQYAQDQGIATGQDLGEAIPYCTHVLRRDAATGQWVSVAQKVVDTWINHEDVSPGYAYMVYTTDSSTWP